MNRTKYSPGSLYKLSPLFLEIVCRERKTIDGLKVELHEVVRDGFETLKVMKRPGEPKAALWLVYRA